MNQEAFIFFHLQHHPVLSFIPLFLQEYKDAELFLVGGAVRDLLLKKKEVVDFDFVIRNLPREELERWFQKKGTINLVGQHFGVYKFIPHGFSASEIECIDIALPRTEKGVKESLGGYRDFDIQSDSTLSIEKDLERRDFTINAMAFDLRQQTLIDPFNGRGDLAQKQLRAVGNPTERFGEDLTRLLRGLRLASELELTIEHQTSLAIKELFPEINKTRTVDEKKEYVVSRETIGIELAKAFVSNPIRAIKECHLHNVFSCLFPNVQAVLEKKTSYLEPLLEIQPNELTVVIALLMRELTASEIRETFLLAGLNTLPREKFSLDPDNVVWLIEHLKQFSTPEEISKIRASIFEKQFMNGRGKILIRCLELLKQETIVASINNRIKKIRTRWLVDENESIAPLLSGQDILAQGIKPGPMIRQWLDCIRDLQLEGVLMRREQALHWLKEELKQSKIPQ
ncbi:CCA tRNA nucleotidyltransferase [Candidatus Uhrbacteria bacterium]|nr:CCA tRNA nucleotidyltransferase [Candidatus Uhrbacteria bacterium]